MARGYFKKGKSAKKSSSGKSGYSARSGRSTAKRGSSGRGTGRSQQVTVRLVLAQEPGGAGLANPALPIPPSITVDKTRKAKL